MRGIVNRILGEADSDLKTYLEGHAAYKHALKRLHMGQPRQKNTEAIILRSSTWSHYYAKNVLCARWPEAEEIIASHPEAAKNYLEAFPEAMADWQALGWTKTLDRYE